MYCLKGSIPIVEEMEPMANNGCISVSCIEVGLEDGEGCRYRGFAAVGVRNALVVDQIN